MMSKMIKKIKLINTVSPIHKMNYSCGETAIWMKRDDLIEFAFGGNKVRLFEYIAYKIKKSNVDRIVTYGSSYSNYLRVAATVSAMLNVECDLIILDHSGPSREGGNVDLLKLFDVNTIHCPEKDAHDFIDEYKRELELKHINYMWIPGGGHIMEASFGYVDAAREIIHQCINLNVEFDAVFLPCGTGTTQAGLIYGLAGTEVIGISVARTKERCIEEINMQLKAMGENTQRTEYDHRVNVIHDDKTQYGELSNAIEDVIKEIARSDGVFLDPIYNAKAFWGMSEYLKACEANRYKNVLYLNTGGQPNLFLKGDSP